MRRSVLVTAVVGLLWSSPAVAQDAGGAFAAPSASHFGAAGTVAIAAERLFGLTHAIPGSGSSVTTISLLGPGGLEAGVAPYSIPRLAVDAFLEGGLTLGIGAELAHMSTSAGGSDSITVVGANPRVGLALRLDDRFTFWPRVGLSYVHASTGNGSYLLAVSVEPQIVFAPLQHVALSVSPTFDGGIAATGTKLTQLGLQFGVLGWF